MGRSRNQRSRGEGTFLEQVKDVLRCLHEEVTNLKCGIYEIKTQLEAYRAQGYSSDFFEPMYTSTLESYGTWGSSYDHHACDYEKTWNVLAAEFSLPLPTIPRSTLLAYRNLEKLDGSPPGLTTSLRIGNIAQFDRRLPSPTFWKSPSVATWLYRIPNTCTSSYASTSVAPSIVANRDTADELHDVNGSTTSTQQGSWTEEQVGSYVKNLVESYKLYQGSRLSAFEKFEKGIQTVAEVCPFSNKPWLFKLLDAVQENLAVELSAKQEEHIDDSFCGKDQEFEDERLGKWWYKGRLICYYCGEENCLASEEQYCEIRRNKLSCSQGNTHRSKERKRKRPKG